MSAPTPDSCTHAATRTHAGITTCLTCTTVVPASVSDARREVVAYRAKRRALRDHETSYPVGCVCGARFGDSIDEREHLANQVTAAVLAALPALPVVDEAALAAALGDLWDDGNTKGLDGWIGRDRGEGDVDQYAVMARKKAIDAVLARLQGREPS